MMNLVDAVVFWAWSVWAWTKHVVSDVIGGK